jgi:uncharacterized damage-inducible protein DinB
MKYESVLIIGDLPGFSPQIGRLVSMMNYARDTTLAAVDGLTVEQLDYLQDERSNTIGALLLHIAAVETWYQAATFLARELSEEEMREWGAALDLGEPARREIKGLPLDRYLESLRRVRAVTLAELGRRNDEWLESQAPFWRGQPANNYFKWFHVFEDEINHRGQIRWLRSRAMSKVE